MGLPDASLGHSGCAVVGREKNYTGTLHTIHRCTNLRNDTVDFPPSPVNPTRDCAHHANTSPTIHQIHAVRGHEPRQSARFTLHFPSQHAWRRSRATEHAQPSQWGATDAKNTVFWVGRFIAGYAGLWADLAAVPQQEPRGGSSCRRKRHKARSMRCEPLFAPEPRHTARQRRSSRTHAERNVVQDHSDHGRTMKQAQPAVKFGCGMRRKGFGVPQKTFCMEKVR